MGGGGSKSITTTSIATKAAVEAMAQNIMNCRSNASVIQSFVVSGNYNVVQNVKQVQNFKLSSSCSQDTKNISELQQSVSNAIKQAAEAQSVSVLGALGSSRAEVNTYIDNEVSQKITQQTIQNIINTTNAQQEMIISGNNNIINNFEQSQTLELLYENCQNVLNELKSVQAVDNNVTGNSKATQTNFISDIVSSIFDGIQGLGILWVIVIVAALGVFGWVMINGGPLKAIFGKSGGFEGGCGCDGGRGIDIFRILGGWC
jgi:hypothetical protein